MIPVAWVKEQLGGENPTKEENFLGVTTDTRSEVAGHLFFALSGPNFDGNRFAEEALKKGALGVVVDDPQMAQKLVTYFPDNLVVSVESTLKSLQLLAQRWRIKNKFQVLAITGSNGKTTTKTFCAHLVSQKFATNYAKGSFNNHIGLPLTLLSTSAEAKVVIVEMGMNHAGEITELCTIAQPDVVVVTMVGSGHIENLGSVEAIAKAKEEIYLGAKDNARRIYNLDNPHTREMMNRHAASARFAGKDDRVLTFSYYDPAAAVHLRDVVSTFDHVEIAGRIGGEPGRVKIPIFGRQNVYNIMAAACVALAAGVEPDIIWKSLSGCKTEWGRNQVMKLKGGARVVFDGYNANPESVLALLENLSRIKVRGRRYAVLGEMLELGSHSAEMHRSIARQIAELKFDFVWFYGSPYKEFEEAYKEIYPSGDFAATESFDESLTMSLKSRLEADDLIVLKGSRGMKLERVLAQLD